MKLFPCTKFHGRSICCAICEEMRPVGWYIGLVPLDGSRGAGVVDSATFWNSVGVLSWDIVSNSLIVSACGPQPCMMQHRTATSWFLGLTM